MSRPIGGRRCSVCGEGVLRPTTSIALRGGGREQTWECEACGHTVQLLTAGGRVTVFALSIFFVAAVPWAMVTERVARESERGWIVLIVALVAAAMIALSVRDVLRSRRFPPL